MRLLELDQITATYGKVAALHELSFHIDEGEIVALLGANGAGKSTTLRVISGLLKPRTGTVRLLGHTISGHSPESIFRLGVAHVPERRRVFPGLTVRENIILGGANRPGSTRVELQSDAARMFDIFPELRNFENALGWMLSGGQQQMVAIARGLMSRPKILLLDEPSLGLGPLVVQQVYKVIADIRRNGTTVLLVEQNANMALSVADRGYVLETGHLVMQGRPAELWDNEDVRAAYLGGRTNRRIILLSSPSGRHWGIGQISQEEFWTCLPSAFLACCWCAKIFPTDGFRTLQAKCGASLRPRPLRRN